MGLPFRGDIPAALCIIAALAYLAALVLGEVQRIERFIPLPHTDLDTVVAPGHMDEIAIVIFPVDAIGAGFIGYGDTTKYPAAVWGTICFAQLDDNPIGSEFLCHAGRAAAFEAGAADDEQGKHESDHTNVAECHL